MAESQRQRRWWVSRVEQGEMPLVNLSEAAAGEKRGAGRVVYSRFSSSIFSLDSTRAGF
jgi:hypothetical protein